MLSKDVVQDGGRANPNGRSGSQKVPVNIVYLIIMIKKRSSFFSVIFDNGQAHLMFSNDVFQDGGLGLKLCVSS